MRPELLPDPTPDGCASLGMQCPLSPQGLWDCFAGALRRSELVALNIEDVEDVQDGMKITIRHSKTDQDGQGVTIGIVRGSIACPVAALEAWRDAAGITTGPLFCSIRKGGQVGARTHRSERCRYRQDTCRARRPRSLAIRRPFTARWLPYFRGQAGSLHFQNDGREPPPLGRYPARLRARCRAVQRPCGGRAVVGSGDQPQWRRSETPGPASSRAAGSALPSPSITMVTFGAIGVPSAFTCLWAMAASLGCT
jgi:hypothetical protein